MQNIKNRLTVAITVFVLFVTGAIAVGGDVQRPRDAEALSPDYIAEYETIYYFSDSTPTFKDHAYLSGYNTVFDVKPFMTVEELKYMIYTGYFWGFVNTYNIPIVIVELKAMIPDSEVLRVLFACLRAQGCKIMFISPYVDMLDGVEADITMRCNTDKHYKFIQNSVKAMADDQGVVYDETTLLLDGRMIGAYRNFDIAERYKYSSYLRALLLNMRHGCSAYGGYEYEYTLYSRLWQVYGEYVMANCGYELDYFNGDTDIEPYIEMWQEIIERYPTMLNDIWQGNDEYYNERYREELNIYLDEEIAQYFNGKNIHILVNVDGAERSNLYIDMLYSVAEYPQYVEYIFSDYQQFGNTIPFNITFLYGMGQWRLELDFYSLLCSLQDNLGDLNDILDDETNEQKFPIARMPVFIWEVDPIETGDDGLEIITSDELESMYDDQLENIEEEILVDLFIGYLYELANLY